MPVTQDGQGKHVALVIGAGSVKCAAALGMWRVLAREDIAVDMIVGCSGGALYAAAMAVGMELEEAVTETGRLWTREVTARRDWPSLLRSAMPGLFKFDERFGLIDDRPLWRRLEASFGQHTFADTVVPLFVLATDFHTGEPVVLHEGRLADALRASVAIPYVWRPWQIGDRLLVDGSASNPMPVDVAIREGAGVILAMGFESPYPRRVKSITRFAFHVNSIMTNALFRANFAFHNLAHYTEIIQVLPDFDRPIGLFDTQQFPYVIAEGERAMEQQLPYLRRLLVAR